MKNFFKNGKYILVILLIAVFASIPLFWKNLDIFADDGSQHIARAYLTFETLKSGENTNVLSSLTQGFGYSWNLFYGMFSTYMIIFFKLIVNNWEIAYKVTLFAGLFLSGLTMYKFASKITSKKSIGVLAAIFYITMPYHLNDMYVRNALGEFLSYIFIPLVFLGLYNLFHDQKGELWLAVRNYRINSYS